MSSLVLPISSTLALALLVWHSWKTRGRTVTLAFFLGGAVFGILRGNAVYYICAYVSGTGEGTKPYLPQGGFFPHIGHESLQIVVGWLFAGYLAWTFAEFVLRRLEKGDRSLLCAAPSGPTGKRLLSPFSSRLFPTVGLAALFMCSIGYCMETAAPRVGWWYWDMATLNPVFGDVPPAGIAAWFSVSFDFLLPVLFIVCSEHRRSPMRWLALLIFPLHMGVHALYTNVPYVDNQYLALAAAVIGLALFGKTRMETGLMRRPPEGRREIVDYVPAVAITVFLAVILAADTFVARDGALALTAIPLAVFVLLAAPAVPVAVVAGCALAGLAAWPCLGFRSLYAFAAPTAFAALFTVNRWDKRGIRLAWLALAAGICLWSFALELGNTARHHEFYRLISLARQARTEGRPDAARSLREQAFRIRFDTAGDIWWSLRDLVLLNTDDVEGSLPEVYKRYPEITRLDPRWAGPYVEWAGYLAADGNLDNAVAKCRTIIGFQPSMGSHHAMLGYLLLRQGKADEARSELEKAVKLGEDGPGNQTNLAVACALLGETARAETMLEKVAGSPRNFVAALDLEDLSATPTRISADLAHLVAPDKYAFLALLAYQRAERLILAGNLRPALGQMALAVHLYPGDPTWRANYATLIVKSGGAPEQAIYQCELALRQDPSMEPVKRNMVRLCIGLASQQFKRGEPVAARATLQRALPYASGDQLRQVQNMLNARSLTPAP